MKNPYGASVVGLEPREAYGAILSVGRKTQGQKGNPVDTDRFFFSSRGFDDTDATSKVLRHPLDPRFGAFNNPPENAKKRQTWVDGNLVFALQNESMQVQLAARNPRVNGTPGQIPPGGGTWESPPNQVPWCYGDGRTALRYQGQDGANNAVFEEIACPNELCFFRRGEKKVCGVKALLYFRPRWKKEGTGMPTCIVRYQTGGWLSAANMLGMFETVRKVAAGMGLSEQQWNFCGLPFTMTVGTHKDASQGRRYPVVTFTLEDPAAFLLAQIEQGRLVQSAPVRRAIAPPPDEIGSVEELADAIEVLSSEIPATAAIPEDLDLEEAIVVAPIQIPPFRLDGGDPVIVQLRRYAELIGLKAVKANEVAAKVSGGPAEQLQDLWASAVAKELAAVARKAPR